MKTFAAILKTEKQREAAVRRWAARRGAASSATPSATPSAPPKNELDTMLDKLPVKHDPNLSQEATTHTGCSIRVGNKYKALEPQWQKEVLTHEAAHFHGLDDWYLKNHTDWDLAAKTKHGHLNGQTTPGEIMAEAYARAWHDPDFLKANAPALIDHVRQGSKAVGLPIPPVCK